MSVDPLLPICAGVALGGAGTAAWYARRLRRPLGWVGLPVLRWQLVGPPLPGSPLNDLRVPASQFEATLRHLARRRFRPVSLSEAVARRQEPGFLSQNPLVLTFDGPSASFLRALEALSRHRLLPVTLFFPVGLLGRAELVFSKGRPEPLMGAVDLAQVAARGVEVGLLCPELAQKGELALTQRLASDRRRLQETTGLPVEHVALPGEGRDLQRAARAAGFSTAVRLAGDGILTRRGSPWAIPRWNAKPGQHLVQVSYALAARRR